MKIEKILAINPGSTSTKIAVFENDKNVFIKNIKHSTDELSAYKNITDQYEFRKKTILEELKLANHNIENFTCIISRGGLIKPISSGVYEINEAMKQDLIHSPIGEHASNLGGLIASEIASELGNVKAYIADPVVVDELQDLARVAGHPNFKRISIFHALNQKAIARRYAKEHNLIYENINLIVAHLGGGITVGAHKCGVVIDVNNGLDGDGPFSPERSGSLPVGQLVELCFSGQYSKTDIKQMIKGKGGISAYLGTNDAYQVSINAEKGDKEAQFILDAMSYQISKEIGAISAVLKGDVNAILITGGIANDKKICQYITKMVSFIAPVHVYPGEDELQALAANALMVLNGEVEPKIYK